MNSGTKEGSEELFSNFKKLYKEMRIWQTFTGKKWWIRVIGHQR